MALATASHASGLRAVAPTAMLGLQSQAAEAFCSPTYDTRPAPRHGSQLAVPGSRRACAAAASAVVWPRLVQADGASWSQSRVGTQLRRQQHNPPSPAQLRPVAWTLRSPNASPPTHAMRQRHSQLACPPILTTASCADHPRGAHTCSRPVSKRQRCDRACCALRFAVPSECVSATATKAAKAPSHPWSQT